MRLNRRHVLRGLLGGSVVTLGLPWLECMTPKAKAASGGFPVRFGLFFWGNGNIPDQWTPEGEGTDFVLRGQLAPLTPHQSKLIVVSGTSVRVPNEDPHESGAAGLLTGMRLQRTGTESTFAGPTIDQILAGELGAATRFRSLELAVAAVNGRSYNGPYSLNPPETSPYLLFERLFGAGFVEPGDEPIIDPTLALRRSVLDAVMGDLERMQGRLGSADRSRLEQHLDGVRDLELRLARLEEDPPNLASCSRPPEPNSVYPEVDGRPQLANINRAFCDLVAMALACDQTRVFSNWFTEPVNSVLFPGASAGHHQLTHDEPGDQPECNAINIQIIEEFAYLIGALDAIPEGDGTLLDHTALLGTTDVSLGRTHSLDDFPILIAGSAGGALRTGQHYRSYSGESASKVMLTLIRSTGVVADSFGTEDAQTTESLSAIEA